MWLSLSAADIYNICIPPPLAHFHLSVCWRHFSIRPVYKLQYSAVPELRAQEIAQLGARIHPELLSIKLFLLSPCRNVRIESFFGSSLDHGRATCKAWRLHLMKPLCRYQQFLPCFRFPQFFWEITRNLLSSIRPHSSPPDIWISPLKRFCIELVSCGFRPKSGPVWISAFYVSATWGQSRLWLIGAEQN